MRNVRTTMMIRNKGCIHQPMKQNSMASPVASTMNKRARELLIANAFLYKENEPMDMRITLSAVPSVNIKELPAATGRTKIPHVFSRSGDGYIEKTEALTKIKF